MKKAFLTELYKAADMRRWNDKIRYMELRELDHQAHKMTIAYILGKYEEHKNPDNIDWVAIIERGIFEFLERLVLTDIKPQVRREIEQRPDEWRQLREMVFKQFEFKVPRFIGFDERFKQYLSTSKNDAKSELNARIVDAAGFCARAWEWHVIEQANKEDYEVNEIKKRFEKDWQQYDDLQGISPYNQGSQGRTPYDQIMGFIDLCGALRFQQRWSHLYRVPRTSVLGHMLIVAVLSYLFSLRIEESLKTEEECSRRRFNNFFGGLFHDFPEALTRDIITPVKRGGIEDIVKKYEKDEMKRRIYQPGLIPRSWRGEMQKFTENEFESKAKIGDKLKSTTSDEINEKYHADKFDPIDGEIIEAADNLAAFLEAYLAIQNGIVT